MSTARQWDTATGTITQATLTTGSSITHGATTDVPGCSECNRTEPKPWGIFTVNYHGEEVCAKCLTPMRYPRSKP